MSIKHPIAIGTAVRYLDKEASSARAGCGYIRHSTNNEKQNRFAYYITPFPWTPFDADQHGVTSRGGWVYMFDYEIVEVLE